MKFQTFEEMWRALYPIALVPTVNARGETVWVAPVEATTYRKAA